MRLGSFRKTLASLFAAVAGAIGCTNRNVETSETRTTETTETVRVGVAQDRVATSSSGALLSTRRTPSPTPTPSPSAATARTDPNAERLEAIDEEVARIEDASRIEGDEPVNEIDARLTATQDLITSLNIEAEIERSTRSDELRLVESRQALARENAQRELQMLGEQIRAQEGVAAQARQQLAMTIAPEQSDLMRSARDASLVAEQTLWDLRARYGQLLSEAEASADRSYAEQRAALDTVRGRQAGLARTLSDAQADLARLTQERERMEAQIVERNARLRQLREERDRLRAEGPGQTPSGG
jgi:hypothetical protein